MQLTSQVTYAKTRGDAPWVFAISAKFVTESMEGTFKDTAIMMMGCDCLHFQDMAQAFIEKGASTYRWSHRSYKVAESSEINIG